MTPSVCSSTRSLGSSSGSGVSVSACTGPGPETERLCAFAALGSKTSTSVFEPRSAMDSEQIYVMKREVLELRRSVVPLGGPLRKNKLFAFGGYQPARVLTNEELAAIKHMNHRGWKAATIDITFPRGQGAEGLTKAMAIDHGAQGIRVNCICPGAIETPMAERIRQGEPPSWA